ncbi:oxalurate catabolism protein HpxZ [Robbsia sp. KACC 23696]|uniref:oxalurate catabolism protein HpxZ n=1 Tax=Robbsia sp. KACC 23696 TaxID=3149231 RepID=UPI00325B8998
MQINLPDVLAEVRALCTQYETALVENDVAVLDALFWDAATTIRYGVSENLYGYDAIKAFRAGRPSAGLDRTVIRHEIVTYGRDTATSCLEFARDGATTTGRQTQTWVRTDAGWRVVAAHVSQMR